MHSQACRHIHTVCLVLGSICENDQWASLWVVTQMPSRLSASRPPSQAALSPVHLHMVGSKQKARPKGAGGSWSPDLVLDHETMCLAWGTPTLEEGHWKARLQPRTASPAESHLVTTAPHQAETESQRWSHPTTVFLNEKQSSFLVGGGGVEHVMVHV